MRTTQFNARQNTQQSPIAIAADSVQLQGDIVIPVKARGIVLFASSSSNICGNICHSPGNYYTARILHQAKLATLLIDLLTPEEAAIDLRTKHFDVELLAARLVGVTDWLRSSSDTQNLGLGYFGTDVGSAAVMLAATQRAADVGAIVSRSGRLDLAGSALAWVQAPTLLIVGEHDFPGIGINQDALAQLHTQKQLQIIPQASHLFAEPGTLAAAAWLASQWFQLILVQHGNSNIPF
jgi:pimeloyl-ACP methyl ester carboxylesterase